MSIKARILEGFKLLLPLILLLFIIGWVATYLEQIFRTLFLTVMPEKFYFPGLGLITGILTLCLLSLAMQVWLIRNVYSWLIKALQRVPLANAAYKWIRNLVKAISSDDPKTSSQPVVVDLKHGFALGFLTDEKLGNRLALNHDDDHVAIYFPMSYQLGGYTLLVPRDSVTKVGLPTEQMFSIIMSAGIVGKKEN